MLLGIRFLTWVLKKLFDIVFNKNWSRSYTMYHIR